jgi:Cytochrome c554 and c-prime
MSSFMTPTVRLVERHRPGITFLAALIGLIAILAVLASPGGASSSRETSAVEPRRVGMNSCAARGCHGAVDSVDPAAGNVFIKGGAATTWLNFDPHARAFDVLLEPRSKAIAARLKGPLAGKEAHEAGLCLSCHATVSPPEPIREGVAHVKDGVSCESCHGPAEVWQETHLSSSWIKKTASAKGLDGMTDLSTPSSRAKACVGCHVGDRSRGMDMNHDLIAAGHPRLNFEFASYMVSYPKHWKEKAADPAEFEAKSWAIGQVVTARAVLQLLADRAIASKEGVTRKAPAPEGVWPEFSEYECFSCHHGLTKTSPLQTADHVQGKPGKVPWGTWPLAMIPDLAKVGKVDLQAEGSPYAGLKVEMARALPDPDLVASLAGSTIRQLDSLIVALENDKLDATRLAALKAELTARKPDPRVSWDLATQTYLARLALTRAGLLADDPALPSTFDLLKFPEKPKLYDSPRSSELPSR